MTPGELTKSDLLKIYVEASAQGKKTMDTLFGSSYFSLKAIDRIGSFEDACAELGKDPSTSIPYPKANTDTQDALNAVAMLWIIAEALCEGWIPDWKNGNQRKWYCWFEYNASGVGFSASGYGGSGTATGVGSRLCFETEEKANHFGKKFIDLHNKVLLKK